MLEHRRNDNNSGQTPPSPPPFSRPQSENQKTSDTQAQQPEQPSESPTNSPNNESQDQPEAGDSDWGGMPPQQQSTQHIERLALDKAAKSPLFKSPSKQSKVQAGKQKGEAPGGTRSGKQISGSINWFATLARNASQQKQDWQWRYKKARTGKTVLHLILLDTSASTLAAQAFAKSKGVVLQIAEQAYLLREQLAVMSFGNEQIKWLLPQVRAPKQLGPLLNSTPAGGGTPIRDVLQQAQQYLLGVRHKHPDVQIQTYLLSDGRTSQTLDGVQLIGQCTFIDTEQSAVKRGRGKEIANTLGASYLSLTTLGAH